jgi:Domain of unknown function (DUF4115)
VAPDLIDDRDEPQDSSPESLLQFLSAHKQGSERRGERNHPLGKRRSIAVLLVVVAAALLAVSFVIWGNFTHRGSASHIPTAGTVRSGHRSHSHSASAHVGLTDTHHDTEATPPKPIRMVLTAARNDSWVQIRKGSFAGPVLFDGIVSEGQSIHVVGGRFWARFGALGNFDLTINGRPVHPAFSGTVDTVITAAAIRRVPAQTQSG